MDFYKGPIGFGLALSENLTAMNAYSAMSEAEKKTVLNKAHNARSREEMHQIVNDIIANPMH